MFITLERLSEGTKHADHLAMPVLSSPVEEHQALHTNNFHLDVYYHIHNKSDILFMLVLPPLLIYILDFMWLEYPQRSVGKWIMVNGYYSMSPLFRIKNNFSFCLHLFPHLIWAVLVNSERAKVFYSFLSQAFPISSKSIMAQSTLVKL